MSGVPGDLSAYWIWEGSLEVFPQAEPAPLGVVAVGEGNPCVMVWVGTTWGSREGGPSRYLGSLLPFCKK